MPNAVELDGPARTAGSPVSTSSPRSTPQPEVSRAELDQAIEQLTRTAKAFNTNLQFATHEATGRIMVKVVDNDTGQVVREIPPQKLLDAAASVQQALGLIFDERA